MGGLETFLTQDGINMILTLLMIITTSFAVYIILNHNYRAKKEIPDKAKDPKEDTAPEVTIPLSKNEFYQRYKERTGKQSTGKQSTGKQEEWRGSYGSVKQCLWDGKEAVVKEMTYCKERISRENIEKICGYWKELKHDNIIQFYSLLFEEYRCLIVMEFGHRGELTKNLDGITIGTCIKWSKQITSGLECLHSKHKVHRDLKCNNIVLDKDGNAKICDFDFLREDTSSMSSGGALAIVAPELWDKNHRKTSKSDIWSFSVVLLTMVQGFSPINVEQYIFAMKMKNGWRPTIPDWCPPRIREVIENCWNYDPEKRPSASNLLHEFTEIQKLAEKENLQNILMKDFKAESEVQLGTTLSKHKEVTRETLSWKDGSLFGFGGDKIMGYTLYEYQLGRLGCCVNVFFQDGKAAEDFIKIDTKWQYGISDGKKFLVLHDKRLKPYQTRFAKTIAQQQFSKISQPIKKATAGIIDLESIQGERLCDF